MATGVLEFQIKRGAVDMNDIDQELKGKVQQLIELTSKKKYKEAAELLLPLLSFEWTWSNCDGDPEDIIENPEDIFFDCDESNTSVRIGVDDDAIVVTISVTFEVQIKDDVTKEEVESWLDENSAWSCGHVSPGWTYSGSDGENIWLTELR